MHLAPLFVGGSEEAPEDRVAALREAGAEVQRFARCDHGGVRGVDLEAVLRALARRGAEGLDGGPPSDPLAPWPDLADYFDVVGDRTRYRGGIDWCLGERVTAYFRYVFEDYQDSSVDYNSGTAHLFLLGGSAIF